MIRSGVLVVAGIIVGGGGGGGGVLAAEARVPQTHIQHYHFIIKRKKRSKFWHLVESS